MTRKIVLFVVMMFILFSITGCSSAKATPYERLVKKSPQSVKSTTTTIDKVTLLSENIILVSGTLGTRGIATFETDGKIYLMGHLVRQPVGSFVVKVDKTNNEIEASNLIGEVISNTENGVIAVERRSIREYETIPVAKSAHLGEAFILGRDEEGNIKEYPINIEAFKEDQNMFFYSSSEIEFCEGTSGSPIIQNNELIGVHFATMQEEKGCAWLIWNLDILNS